MGIPCSDWGDRHPCRWEAESGDTGFWLPFKGVWRADYTAGQAWRLRAPQDRRALRDLPQHDWLAATGI
ncbi:MAG: hypothetical protein M1449_03695, partial [Candidatus Thermoplasmatota archaeon]|nr:hypothetical protein [Candidatus Thermoplasmatota archaeon]